MSALRLDLIQTQRLILTQEIKQSLELLQISTLDLEEILIQEMQENPVLDCDISIDEGLDKLDELTRQEIEGNINSKVENFLNQYEDASDIGYNNTYENNKNLLDIVSREESLKEHLLKQLVFLELSDRDKNVLEQIITLLDDRGFLPYKKDELCSKLQIDLDYLNKILNILYKLDPIGCGVTSIEESIKIQSSILYPDDAILQLIADKYFDKIKKCDFAIIAKELKISMNEVKEKARLIYNMNPYPGYQFVNSKTIYIKPDIEVSIHGDEVIINLIDEWLPNVKLNKRYLELIKKKNLDKAAKKFIYGKVASAKNLIQNIYKRNETLLKVSKVIMEKQKEFLKKGPGYLKPLNYADIESELGFHESTIARAVSNKYAQTPWGIFQFKYFFANKVLPDSDISSDNLLYIIKDIINNEPKDSPYKDEEILDILKKRGIKVARRTVSKYRDILGIPASNIRKKLYFIKEG